jgi:hypothetical protein
MDPLETDSDHHLLVAAASRTQQDSEKRLQELWPRLRLTHDQHGASSQEYRTALQTWKAAQTLWWENSVILMQLS